MVGIIQEQHPARCKLFMQWKQMDWPIMVDALNLLEVKAVPLTFLIDEHGTIVDRPRRPSAVAEWLKKPAPKGEAPVSRARTKLPDREEIRALGRTAIQGGFDPRMVFANTIYMWQGSDHAPHAVLAYGLAEDIRPDDPLLHFRLGVAYRRVFDLETHDPSDFQKAVEHWQAALDADPNQYIWRRRIQQFGPRLMKPYPFYDWVPQARKDIEARGDTPHELIVEPSGAEFAKPSRSFSAETTQHKNPDPEGKINHDTEGFIVAKTVVVPSVVKPGKTVRVHVLMTPNGSIKAHWNNEADDTEMWIDPPEGWEIDKRRHKVGIPPDAAVSLETRTIEFELMVPDDAKPGKFTLPAYALYYVCGDINGVCLFRRQDLSISVTVVK